MASVVVVWQGGALAESFVTTGLVAGGTVSSSLVAAPVSPPLNLGSFNIVINPNATLLANAPALAAFNRAAAQWEAFIADPITVNINAGLASLGANVLGSISNVALQDGFNVVRNAMVADAANETDDAIAAFLPTAAQFGAFIPAGTTLPGLMTFTKANGKALGYANLDALFGSNDATITFSTNFAFDYDNSDGVGAGLTDFETVAAHEIGHALGFVSSVDAVAAGDTSIEFTPLDMYRFGSIENPATNAEFTNFGREFRPGQSAYFDDLADEWLMSTGLTGDGRQASHWKDNNITSTLIGMMDPTLANQQVFTLAAADLRAIDLIGYEIVVPEPATLSFFALAGLALGRRRR